MVSVFPCAERFGKKTTWWFHKLWCLTVEQQCTIMKKRTSNSCMPEAHMWSLNVEHLQVNTCQSKYDWAPLATSSLLSVKMWLSPALATSSLLSEVTHRCFTWSRLHKLLTVITLNSFNGKSNSEMSWVRLSLTDLSTHCVLTWATNLIPFPRIFLKKIIC